jgi:hypothetical protein
MGVRRPRMQYIIDSATADEAQVQKFISGEENGRGTLET